MKDFSLAVGTMPLILRRVFGTARWRPAIRLYQLRTMRKCAAVRPTIVSGDRSAMGPCSAALWYGDRNPRRSDATMRSKFGCREHGETTHKFSPVTQD